MEMYGRLGSRLHRQGQLGVELPMALAAGHQVAVSCLPQPPDAILGRHPPIHHHQGPPGRLQRLQHPGQGAGLIHPPAKTSERRTNPASNASMAPLIALLPTLVRNADYQLEDIRLLTNQ